MFQEMDHHGLRPPEFSAEPRVHLGSNFEIDVCAYERDEPLQRSASEGGVATTLVDGEDPSWAPNSRNIIFTRRKNGRRYLCVLDVFTKQSKDVQKISGSNSQPSWAK